MEVRFRAFRHNLHLSSAEGIFAFNKFSDMSRAEFQSKMLLSPDLFASVQSMSIPRTDATTVMKSNAASSSSSSSSDFGRALPQNFDWTKLGGVSPVVAEGECGGACSALAVTGNIEGVKFVAQGADPSKNPVVPLSPQNLVDCDHECTTVDGKKICDNGCNEALSINGLKYVYLNKGIESNASYPYTGEQEKCRFNPKLVSATIDNVRIYIYIYI